MDIETASMLERTIGKSKLRPDPNPTSIHRPEENLLNADQIRTLPKKAIFLHENLPPILVTPKPLFLKSE